MDERCEREGGLGLEVVVEVGSEGCGGDAVGGVEDGECLVGLRRLGRL